MYDFRIQAIKQLLGGKNLVIRANDNMGLTEEAIVYKQNELETQYKIDEQRKSFNNCIQQHLDKKAQELRYDNMMSARSYSGYDNAFRDEATKLAKWCCDCWIKAGEIEEDVKNGNRDMPTVDEVLAELPLYE